MLENNIKKILTDRIKPSKTTLIVIDVQNDFCHEQGVFSKMNRDLSHIQRNVIPNILFIIKKWRQLNLPIIFVRTIHSDWTNSPVWLTRGEDMAKKTPICPPNSWGAEFYKVEPGDGDCIVTKHRYSAFTGTDLDLILRSKGFETIILTGVVTNVCVETTARDGFNLNYNVIFVDDCCGAYLPEEHTATLNNISKHFGIVTDSKLLVQILEQSK